MGPYSLREQNLFARFWSYDNQAIRRAATSHAPARFYFYGAIGFW